MEVKAPPGGTRIRGQWYDAGADLPPDVQKIISAQQDAAQLGSLLGVNMRQSFGTLDDEHIEGMPPGGGHFPIPHVWTFQGLVSSLAKVYRSPDEAIKHNIDNSRFMRNDLAIMECLEQRQRSGSLLDWHLEVEGDESGKYKDFLADFTKVINATPDFTKWRHVLLEALWYGRYAIQHEYTWRWIDGERRLVVKDWRPVNGDKLVFRYDDGTMQYAPDQMGIRVMTGWNVKPGDRVPAYAYNRDHSPKQFEIEQIGGLQLSDRGMAYFLDADTRKKFVVHRHIIEDAAYESPIDAGSIYGLGIRSRLYWTWFQKQETLSYLMEYIERSALGVEIWFYPYGNKQAEIRTRQAAQDRIGNGRNIILVPKMMGESGDLFGYERIDPTAAGAEQLKDIVTEYFGHQIKRYVLGQTLTSEAAATGLGSGVADIHLDTYLQIIKFDALNLQETITRDFLRNMQQWNYGHTEFANLNVLFVVETEANDVKEKMSAWKESYEMGLKLRARDVYELIGAAVPTATDEVLQDPQHKQMDMMEAQGGMNPLAGAAGAGGDSGAAGGAPADNGNLMQHAELSTNLDHQRLGHHLGVDMSPGGGDGRSRFSRVEGLKKKALGSYGRYRAYIVDGESVRNSSPAAEEFGGMATECLLPDVVPDGEIWIEDDVHDDEIPILISNGLAQYKAAERGADDDEAYKVGLKMEHKLRSERYGAANKAHWAMPGKHDDVYVGQPMPFEDLDVRLVDGEKVRDHYKTDFVEGGHGYVYPFIPNTEIWLESGMHPEEYPVILLHEAAELKAMRDHGMTYHEAHDLASRAEYAERMRRGMAPEKLRKDRTGREHGEPGSGHGGQFVSKGEGGGTAVAEAPEETHHEHHIENVRSKIGGRDVRVHVNPTGEYLKAMIERDPHGLRGLVDLDTGDTYFWPAGDAIHYDMIQSMYLSGNQGLVEIDKYGAKLSPAIKRSKAGAAAIKSLGLDDAEETDVSKFRMNVTPEKYALAGAFVEQEHPRGQPTNVGEFAKKGEQAGGQPKAGAKAPGGAPPAGLFGQPHAGQAAPGHAGHTPVAPKGARRRPDIPGITSPYQHPEIAAFLAGPVAGGIAPTMTTAEAENKWAPLKTVGPNGDGIEYPPGEKILPRENMPQIDGHDDIAAFLTFLGQRGVDSTMQTVAVGTLLPTQKDIQVGGKVKGMLVAIDSGAIYKDRLKWPPILISNDNYIIDGHHRWRALAQLSDNELINAVRINTNIDSLVGNAAAPDGLTMEFLNSGLATSKKSGYFDIKSQEVHQERTVRTEQPAKAERQPMTKPTREWQPEDPFWSPMDDADDEWIARSILAWQNGEYNVQGYAPEKFEKRHAPKGGADIQGKHFEGGQWIPSDVLEAATEEEKAQLTSHPDVAKGEGQKLADELAKHDWSVNENQAQRLVALRDKWLDALHKGTDQVEKDRLWHEFTIADAAADAAQKRARAIDRVVKARSAWVKNAKASEDANLHQQWEDAYNELVRVAGRDYPSLRPLARKPAAPAAEPEQWWDAEAMTWRTGKKPEAKPVTGASVSHPVTSKPQWQVEQERTEAEARGEHPLKGREELTVSLRELWAGSEHHDAEVIRNPHARDLQHFIDSNEYDTSDEDELVRYVFDNDGNLYIMRAQDAIHMGLADGLRDSGVDIPEFPLNGGAIMREGNHYYADRRGYERWEDSARVHKQMDQLVREINREAGASEEAEEAEPTPEPSEQSEPTPPGTSIKTPPKIEPAAGQQKITTGNASSNARPGEPERFAKLFRDEFAARGWPERFERRQAPKGGVTMQGKFYPGGEFIPGEVLAKATPAERMQLDKPDPLADLRREEEHGTSIRQSPLGAWPKDPLTRVLAEKYDKEKPANLKKIDEEVEYGTESAQERGVTSARGKFYRDTFNRVIGRMNSTCVHHIAENLNLALFHKNLHDLQGSLERFDSAGTMGYCSRPTERPTTGTMNIVLDGGLDTGEDLGRGSLDTEEIYAHELSHVIDDMGGSSMNHDWIAASTEEIKDSRQLSNYARVSPIEAWAEFGRLVWTNPKIAKTFFPKCWNVWYNLDLVDEPAMGKTQAEAIAWDPKGSYAPMPPEGRFPSLDESGPYKVDAITEARFDNDGAFTTLGNKSTTRIYFDARKSARDSDDSWYRLKGKERVYLTAAEYFNLQDTMGTTELVSVRSLANRFWHGELSGNPPRTV